MPWTEFMEIGLGVLRLPPDQFWSMTYDELMAGYTGYAKSHGVELKEDSTIDGNTLHEMLMRHGG